MPRLLVATTNRGKLAEIAGLLEGIPFELRTLADFPDLPAPEESGRTFEDNARAKALYYSAATGELTVAEDSGLEVDALDGAPGVESARYGGADSSYPEKFARLYAALRARRGLDSPARFVCALALAGEGRVLFEARGVIEGRIADEPRGAGGFGYDPIFFYPPFGMTLAEAADRKSLVSHRAQAFRALKDFVGRDQAFGPASLTPNS
ncbi:MAG TPA: non-canonical purine NTP pyrophosphatase [Vicinamibacterales bacterium]|jgi:XTP/dITP diphosphohydrolase|nr:non-canonical purine NTP pyrophosphatase [Vicinamibacterales bacterium]